MNVWSSLAAYYTAYYIGGVLHFYIGGVGQPTLETAMQKTLRSDFILHTLPKQIDGWLRSPKQPSHLSPTILSRTRARCSRESQASALPLPLPFPLPRPPFDSADVRAASQELVARFNELLSDDKHFGLLATIKGESLEPVSLLGRRRAAVPAASRRTCRRCWRRRSSPTRRSSP